MPTMFDRRIWLARYGMLMSDKPDTEPDAGGTELDAAEPDGVESDADAPTEDEPTVESLQAQIEAQKRINRNLDRMAKRDKGLRSENEGLRAQLAAFNADGDQQAAPDADAIRAEIRGELQREYALSLAQAKAEAALTGQVSIDPRRAILLMGDALNDAIGDDGALDEQAITDAVTDLLEQNPGLKVAQGGQRFQGTADGGARKADDRSEEQQLRDAIAVAEKSGDIRRSIPLKQQLAALLAAQNKKG